MAMTICLNYCISKVVCGFKTLNILTLYAQEPLEQLLIMCQQMNIDLGSFQMKNLDVHAANILSNQDIIYFMSIKDSMSTEI